jgi:hypothetical protein
MIAAATSLQHQGAGKDQKLRKGREMSDVLLTAAARSGHRF